MEGTARNTPKQKPNAMRSMTEILLYAVDTGEPGSVSVTAMFSCILCVSCVRRTENWSQQKKSTTRYLYLKVALTQEII
jgi:hypothetical protein